MKIKSKVKNGLVFESENLLTEDLFLKIRNESSIKASNVFQTLDWIYCSYKTKPNQKYFLIKGYFNGKLSYLLPLERLFSITEIFYTYINPLMSDYTMPYISNEIKPKTFQEYNNLIEESLKTFSEPKFIFLRNQKDIYGFLPKPVYSYNYTNTYYINTYKNDLNIKFKKKLKYYKNRISRDFPDYVIENFSHNIEGINVEEKDIEEIIKLKNKQYKRTKSNKEIKSFLWKKISLLKNSNISIFVSLLKINAKIASGVICLLHKNILYYMIPVYNSKYKKYSLGILHLNYLINYSRVNKIYGIDLTIGDENYKSKFNSEKTKLFSSFYSNRKFLKPIKLFMLFSYKLINYKFFKFIFKSIKSSIN